MDNDTMLAPEFLSGGGELGASMRAKDWTTTPLGSPRTWPQSLRSAVSICLGSSFPISIYWGRELALLYNDAWSPIPGNKHPAALGRPAREVWPEIWDTIGPMFDDVIATGVATRSQDQLLPMRRHGYTEECYFDYSFSPIRDEAGRVGGIFNAVVETTYRVIGERRSRLLRELGERTVTARTAEEACARAAATLTTAPADMPFCLVYLLDETTSGRRAHLAGAAGLAPGGTAAPVAIDTDDAAAPWPLGRVLATGETVRIDDLTRVFGTELPGGPWPEPAQSALIAPIVMTRSGNAVGFLVAGVSPRRALDDEYQGFAERVAMQISRVIASARAYDEERHRAEALAELDRAKTTFFSNASHEFRTPLALILSPLEDLLARAGAAGSVAERRELELMHRNGLRLLKLVNTLLDFSRIEAGRVQAVYEPVELAAFTVELASAFRSAMDRAGLRFVVACPALGRPVHVDRDMWEKIVLNLLSNAFKYTLQGEVKVTLALAADGETAELRVRDTGVGIPAHELPHLFERFHRIEGQRGRTQEGTGIGLALVHELVRLHGGTVRTESAVGRGSEFIVAIPLGTAHLPADRINGARTLPATFIHAEAFVEEALRWLPSDGAADPAGGRAPDIATELPGPASSAPAERPLVLLADDNADMRDYVRRLLIGRYAVEAVADGEQALAAARRRRPELVLSDVMMPRLDGFGLLKALREDSALRDIPVVLLSARAGEETRVEGIEAGADDYLVKPFSARELVARVDTNIAMARLRRQAADVLREEAHRIETLNRTGAALAAELDLERLAQIVTDNAVELTEAQFGAFFYVIADAQGESHTSHAEAGAPRAGFARFLRPCHPPLFDATFHGSAVVRSDDISTDPRYGRDAPPESSLPHDPPAVRSYLAAPVVSRSGEVLGGLFFGHAEPGIFGERAELIVRGIAAKAAVAMDNARLYRASQEAQAQLRRVNDTLEQRVAAEIATRLKAEEALHQAQKMEAIGHLTGGVAHDFNNLLQAILGNLDALQRVLDSDAVRLDQVNRFVGGAVRGAERAVTLTQQLLAFSRRQPLDPKPSDVNRLVSGMSELLRRTLGERIAIDIVSAAGLWFVSVDPNHLESALLNLAVNARDAMPGGGTLTIETANAVLDDAYAAAHEVASGDCVLIAVTDTGTGMTKDVAASAFDPFFTTKGVGRGTGLGLSQVYGFVKQSEGHVKIYSELGKGTTIKLYLPRIAAAAGAEDIRPASTAAPRSRAGEVILVVDDDEDVRSATGEMLRELGYGVVAASDGMAALRILEERPEIHLLFTDIGLPGGLDGRQLADAVRARRRELPVLFTSGYANAAVVHQGRLDPGVELLPKPFTYAALASKLRHMLGHGGTA